LNDSDRKKESVTRNRSRNIISMKTAAVVITLLLIASTVGWICTEIIPSNVQFQQEVYREKWGDTGYGIINFLRLYDPFHSFWYRSVLALFFISLLTCILTGWSGYIRKSFRMPPPSELSRPPDKKGSVVLNWSELARRHTARSDIAGHYERDYGSPLRVEEEFLPRIYSRVEKFFRGRRYELRSDRAEGKILFSARGGRFHYPGSLIFHVGILIITIGGLIGSFYGRREVVYGRKGDTLSLLGTADSVMIEEFRIVRTEEGGIRDYLTFLRFPGEEEAEERRKVVEVNHPVGYAGYDIYQSSYYVAEDELAWTRIICRCDDLEESFTAGIGEEVELPELGWKVKVVQYLPDFRMSPRGAYSAGRRMRNPAVKLEVRGDFGAESGWVFPASHSMHSTLDMPADFNISYIEPAFYTGLEISRSPHAPVIVAGIAVSVLGLILMFGSQYNVLRGKIDAGGMIIAGSYIKTGGEEIRQNLEDELQEILTAYREGGIHGNRN